jgi:hypothetical protein
MIKLVITASDELYRLLSDKIRAKGGIPRRARDVLQGFRQATQLSNAHTAGGPVEGSPQGQLSGIVVDMSLRAADTLLETLHSRQSTSSIPLVAVKCDGQTLPLALRRLCADVLEASDSAPAREQTLGGP